jgi:RNA recognition motif-containing protein
MAATEEEVKTLFVSGLPDDIKEREIHNLFRIYDGYETCQLKYSGRGFQIVAFAVFTDQASALKAKEALNVWNPGRLLLHLSCSSDFGICLAIKRDI